MKIPKNINKDDFSSKKFYQEVSGRYIVLYINNEIPHIFSDNLGRVDLFYTEKKDGF